MKHCQIQQPHQVPLQVPLDQTLDLVLYLKFLFIRPKETKPRAYIAIVMPPKANVNNICIRYPIYEVIAASSPGLFSTFIPTR